MTTFSSESFPGRAQGEPIKSEFLSRTLGQLEDEAISPEVALERLEDDFISACRIYTTYTKPEDYDENDPYARVFTEDDAHIAHDLKRRLEALYLEISTIMEQHRIENSTLLRRLAAHYETIQNLAGKNIPKTGSVNPENHERSNPLAVITFRFRSSFVSLS